MDAVSWARSGSSLLLLLPILLPPTHAARMPPRAAGAGGRLLPTTTATAARQLQQEGPSEQWPLFNPPMFDRINPHGAASPCDYGSLPGGCMWSGVHVVPGG